MIGEKRKVLNRLRRTEGQIRGIQKMTDERKEYTDVITRLSAVRSNIGRVMGVTVAENLKHCSESLERDLKKQEEQLV